MTSQTHELLLLTLSGDDRPGVTSRVTSVLANYGASILDIGQAVIHDTLSLGILVEIPRDYEASPVLQDLLFCAHELDMQIRFQPITQES